jgi:PKD repeat protein
MTPSDNLVTSSTAYCLANIGQEYVIYLPDGGSVTVDLSDATGTLNVEWYNPKDGTYHDEGTVTGGGSESFTPPFSGDAVLHILLSTGVNHAPVAQDQSVTTPENTPKTITPVATDVDGDTLTYSIVTQPPYGTLSGAAPNVTYTPDTNYHGSDSFSYKANDGTVDSNVAIVSITVTSVNDASVAQDQSVTTDEDTARAITLVATDVDGDTLTYSIVTQPSHGTLGGTAPNMTYTPDANYNGLDSFTFKANDGTVDSNVAIVSMTVTAINDAPVAQDQPVTTDEDTARAITLVATDVDGDTLTYSIVTQPSYGTLSGAAPAPNMTYTPDANYHGSDSFTFKANDGLLDSNVATVSITVGSELIISNLIVASGKSYEVVYSGLVVGAFQYIDRSYTFSAVPISIDGATYIKTANNDKNRAGRDFLSFDANQDVTIYVAHDDRIVPRPSWLHDFVDTGENLLSDDPESDGFSLFKKDFPQGTITLGGNIDSSIPADTKRSMYTVVIVGNGSNHPPVADPNGPYTGTEGVPIAYDGNGSYDTDGTIVSYLWTFGDGNNATGVTPTHIYAQDGTYNVTLTVTDNDGATDTSITTATIADTEPIADFSATPTSGQESLTVTFSDNSTSYDGIEAWDWDFDNDGVTDSNVQNPTHVYAEEGVYTVSLKANESDGDSETMTKTDYIGVTKVNKAPFTPANPSPSDGATDVPIDAVLSWTGGDPDAEDTVTYDVYFGTNTSPPQVAGNQLETTYDPGTRDYSTGYYWRIVATDEHDASNESEVWSFTTTAVPAPETIPPLVSNPSANPDVIPDE